jgi:Flp pilus assembly protein TadG
VAADEGSAAVEFTLVSVLVLALFLLVLQVGLVLHTRNVLTAAAAEGARFGANADRTPQDGADRTRDLLAMAFSPVRAAEMDVAVGPDDGRTVEVVVAASVPVLLWSGPIRLTVHGHALEEAR